MEVQGESTEPLTFVKGLYIDPQYPPASFALKMVTLLYKRVSEQLQHVIWLNCENHLQVKSYLVQFESSHIPKHCRIFTYYTFFDFKHAVYDL